ncbi:putative transcription factor GRF family [Helianthus debilis subsp. tardiflorus]
MGGMEASTTPAHRPVARCGGGGGGVEIFTSVGAEVEVVCACGSTTIIRTSWTATNPGRRFHCCAREGSNCGFVSWAEPPLCARATEIIPGLLRSINSHEEMARKKDLEVKRLKIVLGITWVLCVMYMLFG